MGTNLFRRSNPRITYGFHAMWISNYAMISYLTDAVAKRTIFESISYLFNNPSDAFVSFRAYPFDVEKYCYGSGAIPQSKVYIGNVALTDASNGDIIETIMPTNNFYKNIGEFDILPHFNNFMDFAPYTKIELYVPYCGFVVLDNALVMNKHIKLQYAVDFGSGACTCYIVTYELNSNYEDESNGIVVTSIDGHCGFDIPLGSTNANEKSKQLLTLGISTASGIITTLATKNVGLGLLTLGLGTANSFNGAMQEHISRGVGVSGNQALVSPTSSYLIITRPTLKETQQDYASVKGIPMNEMKSLDSLKGMTMISNINLDGLDDATSTEIETLRNLLNNGVIF